MHDRIEIAVSCFQDLCNQGYSFKAATEMALSIQLIAECLFLKLGIENPSDEQFSEAVACLSATMQKGAEFKPEKKNA
jgi:hypothetical protein